MLFLSLALLLDFPLQLQLHSTVEQTFFVFFGLLARYWVINGLEVHFVVVAAVDALGQLIYPLELLVVLLRETPLALERAKAVVVGDEPHSIFLQRRIELTLFRLLLAQNARLQGLLSAEFAPFNVFFVLLCSTSAVAKN